VTVRVAEPLVPAESVKADVFHRPVQLVGRVSLRLKVVAGQPELSLLFTLTMKFTGVPEVTYWLCKGEMLTVGFASLQVDGPNVTCTLAPVLLAEIGVIVTPEVESL
jgi:hypothetical protein